MSRFGGVLVEESRFGGIPIEEIVEPEETDGIFESSYKGFGRGVGNIISNFGAMQQKGGYSALYGPGKKPYMTEEEAAEKIKMYEMDSAVNHPDFAGSYMKNPDFAGFDEKKRPTAKEFAEKFNRGIDEQYTKDRQEWEAKLASMPEEERKRMKISGERFVEKGRKTAEFGKSIAEFWKADDHYNSRTFLENLSDSPAKTVFTTIAEQSPQLALTVGGMMLTRGLGRAGQTISGGTVSYQMEGGDIFSEGAEFLEKKYDGFRNVPDEEWTKLASLTENHALFNAALDTLLPGQLAKNPAIKEKLISGFFSKEGLKHVTKEGLEGLVRELPTEVVQEASTISAQKGIGKEFTTADLANRYAQVGLAGGGIGLAGGAAKGLSDVAKLKKITSDITEAPTVEAALEKANEILDTPTASELETEFTDDQLAEQASNVPDSFEETINEQPTQEPLSELASNRETTEVIEKRLDPIREDRGERQRLQMPDEFLSQRHREKVAKYGLTPEQAKEFEPNIEKDPVTGYYSRRELEPVIARAKEHVQKTGENAFYVESDYSNMGGGNSVLGTSQFDKLVYTPSANAVLAEIQKIEGADIVPVRKGGDENGFIVVNATQEQVTEAMDKAVQVVEEIAKKAGVSEVIHPKKPNVKGVSLYYGVSEINSTASIEEILKNADNIVELNKRIKENVNRSETQETGVIPSEGQPRAVGKGTTSTAKGAGQEIPTTSERQVNATTPSFESDVIAGKQSENKTVNRRDDRTDAENNDSKIISGQVRYGRDNAKRPDSSKATAADELIAELDEGNENQTTKTKGSSEKIGVNEDADVRTPKSISQAPNQISQNTTVDLTNPKLKEIKVKVKAIEAETGTEVTFEESAYEALMDVNQRIAMAEKLIKCLG